MASRVVAGPVAAMNQWADLVKPLTNLSMSAANEIEGAFQTQGAQLVRKKDTNQELTAQEKVFDFLGVGGYGDEGKTFKILADPDQYALVGTGLLRTLVVRTIIIRFSLKKNLLISQPQESCFQLFMLRVLLTR